MPAYGMPGVATTPRGARLAGALALAAVVAVSALWQVGRVATEPADLRIRVHTALIGDGIGAGAAVSLNGVAVGRVEQVAGQAGGGQLMTVSLDKSRLFGLTDSFDLDYAPSSLFGISQITLKRREGGNPLRDGALVDLTATGRVTDVTLGNLLRALSSDATQVFTPQLTQLLNQSAADLEAFTPLVRAMVGVGRAVADTQRYPSSFLIGQFAAFLDGTAKLGEGTIRLVDEIYGIPVLRNDLDHFDTGVGLVVDRLFPAVSQFGRTARGSLSAYADFFAALLDRLAAMVPQPQASKTELGDLLDRLGRGFHDTPDGPELGLDVALRGVPAVAVPLFGQSGGGR